MLLIRDVLINFSCLLQQLELIFTFVSFFNLFVKVISTREVGNICLSSAFAIHRAVFARALSDISRMRWFGQTAYTTSSLLWWISLLRTALILFQMLWHLSVHRRFLSHAQFFDDSSVFWEAITAESPFSLYRALCYDAGHVRILNILFFELWL